MGRVGLSFLKTGSGYRIAWMDRDGELRSEVLALDDYGMLSSRREQMGESALACIGTAPKKHGEGKVARGVLRSTETINQAAIRS